MATWAPHKGKGPKLKVTVHGKSAGTCEIYFRDNKSTSHPLKIAVATPSPSPTPTAATTPTPSPTPIPIGTPQALGSAYADATTNTLLAVATTQTAPSGSTIVAIGADRISSGAGPSVNDNATCSDSSGDTFTVTEMAIAGADFVVCSSNAIAAPLAAGAYVNLSWVHGSSATFNERAAAYYITGLAASPLDQTATGTAHSTSVLAGPAATTSQANELLFGLVGDLNATASGAAFSAGSNGTANPCAISGTPTYLYLGGFGTTNVPSMFATYCVVNATGAYELQGTLNSANWYAILATLKGVSP